MTTRKHPTRPYIYVTDDGRIFREIIASPSDNGYHTVKVGKETIRRHTLVCEAFHGLRPENHEVRHLDGDASNDNANNLMWGTRQENAQDAVKHGRVNGPAKLSWTQALEIRQRSSNGEGTSALAKEFGISPQAVCDIKANRTWINPPPTPIPPRWWENHPNRGKGHR